MARSNGDIYWKGILEDLFADFLYFFYPDADNLFDIDRGFEFLDKEVEKLFPVGELEHPKFVDKLVKVFTRDGKEEWILIHVEVQGYKDHSFAERMFTYFYRIRDCFGKRVRSIAIFTDNNKKFHPKEYIYEDADTSVVFKYNTYKVIDQDPIELEQSNNPFAWVILTVQLALRKNNVAPEDYLNLTVNLARRLYKKGYSRLKVVQLLSFIKSYANFDKPEINSKFDKEIDILDNKTRTMGIIEQIAEMRREEGIKIGVDKATNEKNTAFVKKLLLKGDYSAEEIAEVAEVSIDFVLQIKDSLNSK